MNRGKNYPLYTTTVFPDFRYMVEQCAEKHPNSYALSYKTDPNDDKVVHVTYTQARDDVRALGTEEISMGLRDKKCAIIGTCSTGWIYTYFSLMAIGAVTVPLDKEMPAEDLAATIAKAECTAVFYGAEVAAKLPVIRESSGAGLFICMNGEAVEGDLHTDAMTDAGNGKLRAGDRSYFDYEIDTDRLASIVF
ncbi:MAG: long-chain fatty acid--CoA ligase, partial [Clostridia bacterium]|nr:long-chain fatty acid--CoA ligase [Clostridia bacterium]